MRRCTSSMPRLRLARETGTFNVLLEFIEYDRSIVLDALGETAAARASYRRYLQLVGARNRSAPVGDRDPAVPPSARAVLPEARGPLHRATSANRSPSRRLAKHCGVS